MKTTKACLLSLLYAVGGGATWVMLSIAGLIAPLGGAAISTMAVWGYDNAKGSRGTPRVVTISVVSMLVFVMSQTLAYLFITSQAAHVPLSGAYIYATALLANDSAFRSFFISDWIMGAVFLVLGSWLQFVED